MTDLLRDHVVLLGRSYRLLRRQPIWVAVMLVQPLVWLLLYSQLFGDCRGSGVSAPTPIWSSSPPASRC